MNIPTTFRRMQFVALAVTCVVAAAVNAGAQVSEINRVKKWDVYLVGNNMRSQQIDYKTNSGLVPISMDDTFMGGFGFGYHFSEEFAWRFEGSFGYTAFRGHGPAEGTTRSATINTGIVNFDWLILPKKVTPYLTAGVGWQYVYTQTSNIAVPVAYWDPWYGHTIGTAYPTHTESDILWTAGLGIRWDVTESFFLRFSADNNWINFSQAEGAIVQTRYGLAIGLMY